MNGRQEQALEQTPEQITAQQYAILLKRNQELEALLKRETDLAKEKAQAYKNKEDEVTQLTSAVLYRTTEADKNKQAYEQTIIELQKSQEKIREQHIQFEKMAFLKDEHENLKKQFVQQTIQAGKLKSKIHWYSEDNKKLHFKISELSSQKEEIFQSLKAAEERALKTPKWKIGMAIGMGLLGALLIVSGIGGALIPAVALTTFIAGTIAVLGSVGYGVYKTIHALCAKPPKDSFAQSVDVSSSNVPEPESPTLHRSSDPLNRFYATSLNTQRVNFEDESKHEGAKCKNRIISLSPICEEPDTLSPPQGPSFKLGPK